MKAIILLCLLLSGCTVKLVDDRINPDQINAMFKQRDENILALAQAVNKIAKAEEEKKKGK